MNTAIRQTQKHFESSSVKTPQYLTWHRHFKRAFTDFLKSIGASNISFSKPNHFDFTGFFQMPNQQVWYVSIWDLRWNKDSMLIRTARDFIDYSGGTNQYASMMVDGDNFKRQFTDIVTKTPLQYY